MATVYWQELWNRNQRYGGCKEIWLPSCKTNMLEHQRNRARISIMEVRLKRKTKVWYDGQPSAYENWRNQAHVAIKVRPQKGRLMEIYCLAVTMLPVVVQSSILWWGWNRGQHQEAKLGAK